MDKNLKPKDVQRGLAMLAEAHPARQAFLDDTMRQLQDMGFVPSLHGRKRWISKVWSPKKKEREEALREAANMRVQATAADILKIALPRIHAALQPMQTRLVSTVHDEVVIDTPPEEAPVVAEIVSTAFRDLLPGVPLILETYVGQNWADRERLT